MSSDPVTITEEEDEDETVIKIKVNQPCIPQKARRGKPFKPAGRGICKNDEVKACSVELDRTPVKTQQKLQKITKKQEVKAVEREIIEEKEKVEDKVVDNVPKEKQLEKKLDLVHENKSVIDEKVPENKSVIDEKAPENNKEDVPEMQDPELPVPEEEKCDEPKESFKMETVAAYVKDVDDLSGTMLTNEEKKKKIEDMCDNLEVKKLEQDVEKILVSRLEVKDAKERIKSLKHILHLLSRYSEDEDEENESKKDSKVTKETETQTNESMITKTDIGTSTSEEQPLVPEYVKDEDNCESEENKLYEKNTDESTEKELDKSKVDETEKDNEKTEEIKLHTVEHHEEKHEIEPEHVPEKKVDESKGENDNTDCEKEKNVKPKEEEDVPLKSAMKEEKKENKDEYIKDDSVNK